MFDIDTELGKAKQALDAKNYDKAKDICKAILHDVTGTHESDLRDKMSIYDVLVEITRIEGRLVDNIMYSDHVIDGARKLNDRETLARMLNTSGFTLNRMGNRDGAMERFKEAEKLVQNFKNQVQYGRALAGQANVLWRSGKNKDAIQMAEKVLEIGLENDENMLTAGAAGILCSCWYELAEFDKALQAAKLSVSTYRNMANPADLARALNNQGEIYKRMKQFDNAIISYQEGISILDSGKERQLGYLLTNLAECQIRKGDISAAQASLDNAKVILEGSEDKFAVACMWVVTGLIEVANDRPEEGIEWIRRAERRMESLKMVYDLGVIQYELASIYMKIGRVDLAVMNIHKAIDVLTKAGSKDLVEGVKDIVRSGK